MDKVTVKLEDVRIDGGTQQRAEICTKTVAEYRDIIANDGKLPPMKVRYDGVSMWLTDGFHRYHAYSSLGVETVDIISTPGTQREAVLDSIGANAAHGLRRNNADKRAAVITMLNDDEWSQWSDRKIAETAMVSHTFVANIRRELGAPLLDGVDGVDGEDGCEQDAASGNVATDGGDEGPANEGDVSGVVIPTPFEIAQAEAEQIGQWHDSIKSIAKQVKDECEMGGAYTSRLAAIAVTTDLRNALRAFKFAMPHAACPKCEEEGCETCKQTGWVTKAELDRIPQD